MYERGNRRLYYLSRRPGDRGSLVRVDGGYSEESRTRGFASLTLVRFAFVGAIMDLRKTPSILGFTDVRYGSAGIVLHQDARPAGTDQKRTSTEQRETPPKRGSQWTLLTNR